MFSKIIRNILMTSVIFLTIVLNLGLIFKGVCWVSISSLACFRRDSLNWYICIDETKTKWRIKAKIRALIFVFKEPIFHFFSCKVIITGQIWRELKTQRKSKLRFVFKALKTQRKSRLNFQTLKTQKSKFDQSCFNKKEKTKT